MIILSAYHPELLNFVLLGIVVIFIGGILRRLRQPYVIAYILAGVLMGKHGFEILTDEKIIQSFGELGLILLLFFIGMEINLASLIKKWEVPIIGTLLQIFGSIFMVGLLGWFLEWNINRIIILGFIISLSSSAIVIKLLQDSNEIQNDIGQKIIGILLVQDILIVPMLIATNYLGGSTPSTQETLLQVIGGVLIITGLVWVMRKKEFNLPFVKNLNDDHELQGLIAFIFCFGFALITALFGLSAALGAFVGGIVVNASRSTKWFHESLNSFRILFVALFFVSIGMLIDIQFLVANWKVISLILFVVYLSNHFINSLVLYFFGTNWRDSLYGGALLAQVGELSFLLVSSAFFTNIITDFEYQLTIIVISLTLLISPFWIMVTKGITKLKSDEVIKR